MAANARIGTQHAASFCDSWVQAWSHLKKNQVLAPMHVQHTVCQKKGAAIFDVDQLQSLAGSGSHEWNDGGWRIDDCIIVCCTAFAFCDSHTDTANCSGLEKAGLSGC